MPLEEKFVAKQKQFLEQLCLLHPAMQHRRIQDAQNLNGSRNTAMKSLAAVESFKISLDATKARLVLIALKRIKFGTYDVCVECDSAITKTRLKAVPWADRCEQCQQRREEVARSSPRQ